MNLLQPIFAYIKDQLLTPKDRVQPATVPSRSGPPPAAKADMRVTRSRAAAVKRPAADMVELDSDEFEEALAAQDDAVPKRSKRQRQTDTAAAVKALAQRGASSKASCSQAAANTSSEEYEASEDEEELEKLQEVTEQQLEHEANSQQGDASDSDASGSSESDSAESEYEEAASNQQKGKAAKKPRKKRPSNRRLCVTYAKRQYHLTDRDLAQLTDIEYRDNPHYAGGFPMKLYLVRELEELARHKQQKQALLAATAEDRALERAAAARAKRAAAAEAAAAAVKAIGGKVCKTSDEKHGSVKLPDTCLTKIMEYIADTLEPGGLRGPSCVARELYNASLVCWDFYHAAKAGFIALGEAADKSQNIPPPEQHYWPKTAQINALVKRLTGLQTLPGPNKQGWAFWDELIQDPTNFKLPELKAAVKQLGSQVTGTKAELVLRVLDAFGLTAPTTAPAQLLRVLSLERAPLLGYEGLPDMCEKVRRAIDDLKIAQHESVATYQRIKDCKGVAGVRALLSQFFNGVDEMAAGAEAALAEFRRKQAERAAAQRAEWQRRMEQQRAAYAAMKAMNALPGQGRPSHLMHANTSAQQIPGGKCHCGNAAAQACSRACCAQCCRRLGAIPDAVRCDRHNTGRM